MYTDFFEPFNLLQLILIHVYLKFAIVFNFCLYGYVRHKNQYVFELEFSTVSDQFEAFIPQQI